MDEGKEYPFAKFNKSIEVPTYTEVEYQHHLVSAGWTRCVVVAGGWTGAVLRRSPN